VGEKKGIKLKPITPSSETGVRNINYKDEGGGGGLGDDFRTRGEAAGQGKKNQGPEMGTPGMGQTELEKRGKKRANWSKKKTGNVTREAE